MAEPVTPENVADIAPASSLAASAEVVVPLASARTTSAAKEEMVLEVSDPAPVPEVAPPVVFGDELDVKEISRT